MTMQTTSAHWRAGLEHKRTDAPSAAAAIASGESLFIGIASN
jgi:hypothetical protein